MLNKIKKFCTYYFYCELYVYIQLIVTCKEWIYPNNPECDWISSDTACPDLQKRDLYIQSIAFLLLNGLLHHLVTFQHSEKRCHHVFNMWERISTGNKIANNQWMTKLFPLKFFAIYCCYRQNIASEKLKKNPNILFSYYKARVQLLSLNTFKVDCAQQITSSRLVCKTWMHVQHAHGARDKLGEGVKFHYSWLTEYCFYLSSNWMKTQVKFPSNA